MRITESQLRRIIRKLVKEAPLADFYPVVDAPTGAVSPYDPRPADAGSLGRGDLHDEVGGPGSLEKLKRVYSHPNFSARLKKLLQSFPIEVYVLPIALDEAGLHLGERLTFYDKKTIFEIPPENSFERPADQVIKKGDAVSFMRKWALESPAGSCLICPISYSAGNVRQGVTPWMIFHSFFDSNGEAGTDYRILKACPSVEALQNNVNEIPTILEEEGFYVQNTVDKREPMKLISKIFTFGSARANYLSRFLVGEWVDLENEASVQACLTTKGFTYNPDAVEALPISEESKEQIYSLLDEAVSLSPACKSEFANFLKDKIVIVGNLPE